MGETWDGTKRRLPALAAAVVLTLVGALVVVAAILGGPIALLVSQGLNPLTGILMALAVLLLVLAYLFLWTRTAFVTSVIVLEGRGALNAFARSWRLTSGTPFWRILGIRLLTSFLVGTAAQIVLVPITLVGVLAIFAGLVVLLTTRDFVLTAISVGIGFIVVLMVVALVGLGAKPSAEDVEARKDLQQPGKDGWH